MFFEKVVVGLFLLLNESIKGICSLPTVYVIMTVDLNRFFCLLQDKKSAVDSSEEITEAKG